MADSNVNTKKTKSKIKTKSKFIALVISFMILVIVILFGFKRLDMEVSTAREKSIIDPINWANDANVGFQPNLIEEYITNIDDVKKLVADLNEVLKNGETPEVNKVQQNIILKIHQYIGEPDELEKKIKGMTDINKINLKRYWFEEDDNYKLNTTESQANAYENYGVSQYDSQVNNHFNNLIDNDANITPDNVANQPGGYGLTIPDPATGISGSILLRDQPGLIGNEKSPSGKLYAPPTGSRDQYLTSNGHHNRLLPNKKNMYLNNPKIWNENSDDNLDRYYTAINYITSLTTTPAGGAARPATLQEFLDKNDWDTSNWLNELNTGDPSITLGTGGKNFIDELLSDSNDINVSQQEKRYINKLLLYNFYYKDNTDLKTSNPKLQNFTDIWDSEFYNNANQNGRYPDWFKDDLNKILRYNYTQESYQDPYFRILNKWNGTDYSLNFMNWLFKPLHYSNENTDLLNANQPYFISVDPTTPASQFTLNTRGRKLKKYLGFLQDYNLINTNPIWPLESMSSKKHKSEKPILEKNKGSFDLTEFTAENIAKEVKASFLITVFSLISRKKKVVIGCVVIYVVLSLYLYYYYHKKSKYHKKTTDDDYDDVEELEKETKEEKTRRNKYKKRKKILNYVLPITYYIISLFMITSFYRFKYGKINKLDTEIKLEKVLENASSNIGDYLYTPKHIELLKKKLENYKLTNIPSLTIKALFRSGIMIFILTLGLYFALKFFNRFPTESKIGLFIIIFLGITYGVVRVIMKYKELIYLFSPSNVSLFGTGNKAQMLIMTCMLLGLTLLYILLVGNKLGKYKLKLDTNGQTILKNKMSLTDQHSVYANDTSNLGIFTISGWFYFNVGSTSSDCYNCFFNFREKLYFLFNSTLSTLKIISVDSKGANDVYTGKVNIQKWINILVNYNGTNIDVFIDTELVSTRMISIYDYKSYDIICGNQILPKVAQDINIECGETNIKGGMSQIVYYNNILNLNEIRQNYLIFKNTL